MKDLEAEIYELWKIKSMLLKRDKRSTRAKMMTRIGDWILDAKMGEFNWSEEVYQILWLYQEDFRSDLDSVMSRFEPDGCDRFLISTSQGHYDNERTLKQIPGVM
jgi:hypothetical protein